MKELDPAVRQYRHNTGEGFVIAYEWEEVEREKPQPRATAMTNEIFLNLFAMASFLCAVGSVVTVIINMRGE